MHFSYGKGLKKLAKMADEEHELLIEDGRGDEEEGNGIDEGLIVQLSKRDSGRVIGQRSRQTRRAKRRTAVRVHASTIVCICTVFLNYFHV